MNEETKLILSQAPHIRSGANGKAVMWLVVIALMPATVFSIVTFGIPALMVLITAVVSAIVTEWIVRALLKRPLTIFDGSAFLTGLLLGMNLPPDVPLYLPALGSFFAITVVKELFGGLGYNIFNPALAGRAFLMASWPALMTTKWHHFSENNVLAKYLTDGAQGLDTVSSASSVPLSDAITGATPLALLKEAPQIIAANGFTPDQYYGTIFSLPMLKSLAVGTVGGCIGETSALFLLIGALFLIAVKIVNWRIPVFYIGSFTIVISLFYSLTGFEYSFAAVIYHLLSGGLILGAFFMATDMVTSPMTNNGMIIFAVGGGLIASLIRLFGGYPEGVSYSILLMNAAVPLIDKLTVPKIYGTKRSKS